MLGGIGRGWQGSAGDGGLGRYQGPSASSGVISRRLAGIGGHRQAYAGVGGRRQVSGIIGRGQQVVDVIGAEAT